MLRKRRWKRSTEDLLFNVMGHDDKMRREKKIEMIRKLRCKEEVRKKVEEMVESIVMDIVEEVWKEDQDGGRKVYEEDVEEVLQDTDEEESPGWGNSPSVLRPSQDQRDGEQERGGAYYEIFKESSASYNAGLLAGCVVHEEEHLESKGPDQGAHTPQIDGEGPLEGGGPETGFPTPSVGGGGPLEGGNPDKKGGTALHEPTDGVEEGVGGITEEEIDRKLEELRESLSETEYRERLEENCEGCGLPVEELEMCMLGLDVEALFPSMTSARTGELVRKRMMRSTMKVEGFNYKMGLVYIQMNRDLTPGLGRMWKILPHRRKVGGTAPGMASKAMSGKGGDVEEQWVFKNKEINEEQKREIVGRCIEIAIRVVFENFMYDFGGKTRLQKKGGPIGARLTMACSRIVMLSWGEQYLEILREAKLQVSLMKIYVDDVRQVTTPLRMGSRFSVEEKRMVETGAEWRLKTR